ncbi:hypothetical protein [Labilibacter marinus]|uniref:hypothetical protein n=1 Tax=Labilibacter marinus TaxID=1477105 RepID=UPI0009502AFB|nr:hypothetical protein [Labilibacter marinus]
MEKDLVQSLKEFFFDIIGFLVPGTLILVIINHYFNLKIEFKDGSYILLIISYSTGYLIFAITLLKDRLLDKLNKCKKILCQDSVLGKLKNRKTYIEVSEIINKNLGENKELSYKGYRNIAMSAIPESDKKIFTFMFRAELFNQLHTICVILFMFCIIQTAYNLTKSKSIIEMTYSLMVSLIGILALRRGWERFYSIAMSLPFSIYLEKRIKND